MFRGRMNVNEGMPFGNMVSQEPVASGHDPLFCKFSTKGSEDLQELDSVIVDGERSIPIKCKSGNMLSRHISLDRLMGRYQRDMDVANVVHTKNPRVEGKVVHVPICMTMSIRVGHRYRPPDASGHIVR